jgi:hypothetical protein
MLKHFPLLHGFCGSIKYLKAVSFLLLLTVSLMLPGCSRVVLKLYGMKKIRAVEESKIIRVAEKYNIPLSDNFELDTSYFVNMLSGLSDTVKVCLPPDLKNHSQPLQLMYYDRSGWLQSFHNNCYAGGFPNLKFDRGGTFTTFPPMQRAPVDSLMPLGRQLKSLRPLKGALIPEVEQYDYVVIVFWDIFMGRQSRRLLGFVRENCKLAADKKVKVIYVNIDNAYAVFDR